MPSFKGIADFLSMKMRDETMFFRRNFGGSVSFFLSQIILDFPELPALRRLSALIVIDCCVIFITDRLQNWWSVCDGLLMTVSKVVSAFVLPNSLSFGDVRVELYAVCSFSRSWLKKKQLGEVADAHVSRLLGELRSISKLPNFFYLSEPYGSSIRCILHTVHRTAPRMHLGTEWREDGMSY